MKINKAAAGLWKHKDIKKIKGVSTDTRSLKKGDLYIPLKGENFDGHNFIQEAMEAGAELYLYSHDKFSGIKGIPVDDTLRAYSDLARAYREEVGCEVIGITGSTGKTTTKNILQDIMERAGKKVHSTFSNENNTIGVPRTVLAMPEDTEILIVEMGTNTFGEIEKETHAAKPDMGMIMNIGPSHLQYFGDLNGVFKEKSVLLHDVIDRGGKALIPDEELFSEFFGKKNVIKVTGEIRGGALHMRTPNKFTMPLSNITAFYHHNILFAVAAALELGVAPDIIAGAVESHKFVRMDEFQWIGKRVIDDSYNANPVSFEKALRYLFSQKGRKALVLGRMLELGESEKIYEEEIFSFIESNNTALVIAKGDFAAEPPEEWIRAKSQKKIVSILKKHKEEFDIVFLKGSHGTNVYKVAELLREEG